MTKAEIIAIQKKLGVKPDGIIGPNTRAAAKKKGIALPPPVAAVKAVPKPAAKPAPKAAVPAPPKFKPPPKLAAPKFKPPPKVVAAKPAAKKVTAKKAAPKSKAIEKALASGETLSPEVMAEAVSAMPAEARTSAAAQLSTLAASPGTSTQDLDALVASLASSITPELSTIKDALAAKEVVTGATSESNALITEADRWANTAARQAQILEAIKQLAVQVVARDRLTQRLFTAYGVQTG